MKKLLLICLVLILSACSKKPPSCADSDAVDIVIQIATKKLEISKKIFAPSSDYTISVKNIRTLSKDGETGSFKCAATIKSDSNNIYLREDKEVTYTTELTEDTGEAYVTVYGF